MSIDEVANNIALAKAFDKFGITHAITFHSRVSGAKGFSERHRELFRDQLAEFVCGEHSASLRKIRLDDFARAPRAVMSNARCLTEGVDVPDIDCVYFCDPRNSLIDIVQATGRALRKPRSGSSKKIGYIVVPIFHHSRAETEQAIGASVFSTLVNVVRAMAANDQRLADEIKEIRLGRGQRKKTPSRIVIDLDDKVVLNLPYSRASLEEALYHQVVSKVPIEWRAFDAARDFARNLQIKNAEEWRIWSATDARPVDIPSNVAVIYKDRGWINWGDWLGTGTVSNNQRSYRSYEDARSFVHTLNIAGQSEWKSWATGSERPDDVPSNPQAVYKDSGWQGFGDWLGTGYVQHNKRRFLDYFEARTLARSLKLPSAKRWQDWAKTPERPPNVPSNADQVYKRLGSWISWADFLGLSLYSQKNRQMRNFDEARQFARSLHFANIDEWRRWAKTGDRPIDIPAAPDHAYRNQGWDGWGDWIGTGRVANQQRKFKSFSEARIFSRALRLKSQKEWQAWAKSVARPSDIPSSPSRAYKEEWVSWSDWLSG